MFAISYAAVGAVLASLAGLGFTLITRQKNRHRPRHAQTARTDAKAGRVQVTHSEAKAVEVPVHFSRPAEIGIDALPDLPTAELAHTASRMRVLVAHMYHELHLRRHRDEGLDDIEEFLQQHGETS